MAAWILARTAPAARSAIGLDKPLARDFYRTIERARTDRPERGWQRLTDVAALVPGDVFAWLKPEIFKQRANTGHVGFVVRKPWRHPKFGASGAPRAYGWYGEAQDPATFVPTEIALGRVFR